MFQKGVSWVALDTNFFKFQKTPISDIFVDPEGGGGGVRTSFSKNGDDRAEHWFQFCYIYTLFKIKEIWFNIHSTIFTENAISVSRNGDVIHYNKAFFLNFPNFWLFLWTKNSNFCFPKLKKYVFNISVNMVITNKNELKCLCLKSGFN